MMTKEEAEKAYADLIQLRRSEVLEKDKVNPGIIEIHHILPKSCGGIDEESNKIALYAKEHFMVHVYLWIIHHDDDFHYQTVCALNQMIKGTVNGSRKELREFILQSEEYQKAREEHAQYCSESIGPKIAGEKNGMFGKCWIKNPSTYESKLWNISDDLPIGWIKGRFQLTYDQFLNKQHKEFQKKNDLELKKQKRLDDLRRMYKVYQNFGFEAVQIQFSYPYTQANFVQMRKTYLVEFVSQMGKQRKKN